MTTAPFDPHDPSFLADPYPTYARLRDESSVVAVAPYGAYWVFGRPVNRAARVAALAHGGQILLSATAAELLEAWSGGCPRRSR